MSDDSWSSVEIPDKYEVTKHLKEELLRARKEFGKASPAEMQAQIWYIVNAIYALEQRIVDPR
jgi:hypothetical protein